MIFDDSVTQSFFDVIGLLFFFGPKQTSQRRQPSVRGGIFCEPLKMLVSSKARRAK